VPPRPPDDGLRLKRSQTLLARARSVDAMIDARPDMFFTGIGRLGGLPLFVKRAAGAYLWDVDSNRYLDFLLGYGSVVLGHAHPAVERAVARERRALGSNPTLLSARQVELAERLVTLCPGVEAVTFLKTGSDATDAAARLARAVTGRELVLRWGMNGWHDWCAPVGDGVPAATRAASLPLRFGDLEDARRLFRERGQGIAAIILMPYELHPPDREYLQGLQDLCRAHGALFVLDEIRSGFRIAIGGVQETLGITADLVTYGKALSNGYALSVLGGAKRFMSQILRVGLTITYFRQSDPMAAALATLDVLVEEDGPARLDRLGARLMAGLDAAAAAAGVPARAIGLPATPFVQFSFGEAARDARAMRIFCNAMLESHVLLTPAHHWFLCTAMREEDIDYAVEASQAAMGEVARAM
jgi:glutamate-1-semialdehyde 2,1-aminomutase